MAIIVSQIPIASDGSVITVFTAEPINEASVGVKNTGAVTVLLGGSDGNCLFPLAAGDVIVIDTQPDDTLKAKVQTNGTAGQLTTISA